MKQIEKLPLLSLAGRGIGFLHLPTADDMQTWGGGLYHMTGFIHYIFVLWSLVSSPVMGHVNVWLVFTCKVTRT